MTTKIFQIERGRIECFHILQPLVRWCVGWRRFWQITKANICLCCTTLELVSIDIQKHSCRWGSSIILYAFCFILNAVKIVNIVNPFAIATSECEWTSRKQQYNLYLPLCYLGYLPKLKKSHYLFSQNI